MPHDYYHLPNDEDELLALAGSVDTRQIIMGEVNIVHLCRVLATKVRLYREMSRHAPIEKQNEILMADLDRQFPRHAPEAQ